MPRPALGALEDFVRVQPAGYRQGLDATGDAAFHTAVSNTMQSYMAAWALERGLDVGSPVLDILSVVPLDRPGVLQQCPVYALDDLSDAGLTAGSLRLIQRISAVEEDARFAKKLASLNADLRGDWERRKAALGHGLPSPPRFEKLRDWKPPTWSLRLRDGYRVHLRIGQDGEWRAVDVGSHKEMGHD